MFLIIGVWGGARRIYASFKFFLYTLLGSVLMLLAIMAMYWQAGTSDIADADGRMTSRRHADLALARLLRVLRGEDADVAGAHLAARRACRGADRRVGHPGGILLKMGGYGFLRFSLPMFPLASDTSRRLCSSFPSSPSSTPRWWR